MAIDLAPPPPPPLAGELEVAGAAVGGKKEEGEGEEGGVCGGEAVVVAAADAEVEGHPYDFHVSGPRNLPPPNWREIIRSSWLVSGYSLHVSLRNLS
jgi:hypothetical protein